MSNKHVEVGPRDRMVIGAAAAFRARGISGATLVGIAEESGASRGSIYHHFPGGKEQLATEAVELAGRFVGRRIHAALTRGPAATVTELIDYFRAELPTSDFTAGCPVAAGALEFGEAPLARAMAGDVFAAWEQAMASGFWQHGLPRDVADELATSVIASIQGALILARARRSLEPLDRVEGLLHRHVATLTGNPATHKTSP